MVKMSFDYQNPSNSTCVPGLVSERHAMIRWKTPLQRWIYTLFYAFPLVLGFPQVEEKQQLDILMAEEYKFSPPNRGDQLVITASLSDSRIELYQASLLVRAQLSGLSYYCYHYFYTALIIGSLIIFACEIFITICIVIAFLLLRYNQTETVVQPPPSNRTRPKKFTSPKSTSVNVNEGNLCTKNSFK